jgi:hypothetical protein
VRGRPHGGAGWIRHAAADLTPEAIEAIAKRVAELLAARTAAAAQPAPVTPARLLDVAEVARHLGVTRAWVYQHARELGAVRIGGGPRARLRFDVEALDARLAGGHPDAPRPRLAGRRSPPRARRRPAAPPVDVPLLPVTPRRIRAARLRASHLRRRGK